MNFLTKAGAACLLASVGACGGTTTPFQSTGPAQELPVASSEVAPKPIDSKAAAGNQRRDQIADTFKWKLDALFPNDAAFEQALDAALSKREQIASFKGKLAQPSALRACLDLYFETRLLTNRLTLFANLRLDTDLKSTRLQAANERALAAMQELIEASGFVRQEILKMSEPALKAAYEREPALKKYRPFLNEWRRRRSRIVGDDGERILALAGDNLWAEVDLNELPSEFEKTFGALVGDVPLPQIRNESGDEVQLSFSNYPKFRASSDRRVRSEAVGALLQTLRQFEHGFASTLAGQVKLNVMFARARGYKTARDAYLDKDNIDPATYDTLLHAVNANLGPLHRYMELRKRLMKVDELRLFDLYTPMVAAPAMTFTFDEARSVLPQALAPLGKEYVDVLTTGLDPTNGWVDLFPHVDKKSGAFCSSVFGVHPFLKMNYYGGFDDLSTLAHEFGHAVHSHLSMTHQPYVTSNYAAFIAEIASTTNEKLLSDWLVTQAKSDAERLYVMNQLVDRIRTTIYRQALFAEFEYAIHFAAEKGTPLTAELFDDTYARLLRTYYGDALTVGPNDAVEWAYIPHLYYKYYVFAYATGFSAGIAIAENIKNGGIAAREAYLTMLRGGSSKPPLELLRGAGVDLTKPDAIEAAAHLLDRTVSEMARMTQAQSPR